MPESAGSNCASGGTRIDIGYDANNNGTLDASEVSSTSYTCNGATGPAGAAGPGVTWVSTIGTTQQAASNTGYMTNNTSQVSITLPASPSVGDIVQVTGVGTGGWKITQNAGQSILTKNLPMNPRNQMLGSWVRAVASSTDGRKIVAATYGGLIYTSADAGTTWVSTTAPTLSWQSVASSADGTKLVAVPSGGQIYTSTDSGATWTPRATTQNWSSVASSSDGTKLVAAIGNGGSGQIYTSTDSGATWTATATALNWFSVASSSDGMKLVAVVYGGQIYTSTDSGTTWTPRATSQNWQSVASSSDGSKLIAVYDPANGTFGVCNIYTSLDSGVTWTLTYSVYGSSCRVASSSDGNTFVAAGNGGEIYTSSNNGTTWGQSGPTERWESVTISSDGTRLIASTYSNQIYTYMLNQQTTTGTNGSLNGNQNDAIELQYIGNNKFNILSSEGAVVAQ